MKGSSRLWRLPLMGILAYVSVCMLATFLQSKLIYFPSAEIHSTPADIGLAYEELRLRCVDGVSISAWYVPGENSRATVLFCHGNAGNVADRLTTIEALHRLGCNILIFDYRGYGRSEGWPNEQGIYQDARAAWDYLVDGRAESPSRIVCMGESLGGAVAIELAAQVASGALVVESTFPRLVDVARLHYPWLPVHLLLKHRYEAIDKLPRISCPKLFFHATHDELVPIDLARQLFAVASEPKRFVETPGDHNSGGFLSTPDTLRILGDFLDQALGQRGAPQDVDR